VFASSAPEADEVEVGEALGCGVGLGAAEDVGGAAVLGVADSVALAPGTMVGAAASGVTVAAGT
jgi:hypothetical protein